MKATLYKQGANEEIRVWSIEDDTPDSILMLSGVLNGTMTEHTEAVAEGKGGRTQEEQMMSRMASRIGKKRDEGYVNSLDHARNNKPTNQLNMPKPMLAKPYKDVKLVPPFLLQYKYDGNRCLITKQNGLVFAYSRNGKPIESIDHILEAAKDIPEGMILDGELYCHGVPLQTLRSWIAKKQAESNGLVYMCYDYMDETLGFENRLLRLESLTLPYPIRIAPTTLIDKVAVEEKGILARLKEAKDAGYEGLIARHLDEPYQAGKRPKCLVKIKSWEDAEFPVIDVISSVDGWAVLVCDSDAGQFNVSAPGSMHEKTEVLDNKEDYIGKKITVEYANLTNRGVPFRPVAIAWRSIED